MLVSLKLVADFSRGCAGGRIGNTLSVTHPSSRASARLVKVGRAKTWDGVSHAASLQNLPDNADNLTNKVSEAP
jgi:hypothetical protein